MRRVTSSTIPPAQKTIVVLCLGGTISVDAPAEGRRAARPSFGESLTHLVSTLDLPSNVTVQARRLSSVSSTSLSLDILATAHRHARDAVAAGVAGVVITMGTDTLEEVALLLDLCWDRPQPLIVTGAMRPDTVAGADGPANLQTAIIAAAADTCRSAGVLVAFDQELHRADEVVKHSNRQLSAYRSRSGAPWAAVDGYQVRPLSRPAHQRVLLDDRVLTHPINIPTVALGLLDEGEWLGYLSNRIRGLVVVAPGTGRVHPHVVPRLTRFVKAGVPVVVSTRVPHGGITQDHYSDLGSETDLTRAGCIMAGSLAPQAARILLHGLVAAQAWPDRIRSTFARFQA